MEKISIIVPTYNNGDKISKCLDSLINQEYKDLEIIVVNDGSTDDTEKVLEEYSKNDSRIKIFTQENKGVSNARNNGIRVATGDYISFVDSDDWVEKNYISLMLSKLKENNVDAVRCNYIQETKEKKIEGSIYDLANKKFTHDEFIQKGIIGHFLYSIEPITNYTVLLLVKSEIIKKISFDESLYMLEDMLFYEELFNNIESIYFLKEGLYHVEENFSSATRSIKRIEKNIYGIMESTKKITKYIRDNNIEVDINLYNTSMLNSIMKYLNKFGNEGDYKTIKQILHKLYNNDDFKIIIGNCNPSILNGFRKTVIKLIKSKRTNLIIILYKIRKIMK